MAYLKGGPESSRIGFNNNVGYSNRIYKEESPQRIFSFSPSKIKNDFLSPVPSFHNQSRR